MALRKRLKRKKPRRKLTPKNTPKQIQFKKITGYAARTDPVCTKCKRNKPLNWYVKTCADVFCSGTYKSKRRSLN